MAILTGTGQSYRADKFVIDTRMDGRKERHEDSGNGNTKTGPR